MVKRKRMREREEILNRFQSEPFQPRFIAAIYRQFDVEAFRKSYITKALRASKKLRINYGFFTESEMFFVCLFSGGLFLGVGFVAGSEDESEYIKGNKDFQILYVLRDLEILERSSHFFYPALNGDSVKVFKDLVFKEVARSCCDIVFAQYFIGQEYDDLIQSSLHHEDALKIIKKLRLG
jgi:hypothetical protein